MVLQFDLENAVEIICLYAFFCSSRPWEIPSQILISNSVKFATNPLFPKSSIVFPNLIFLPCQKIRYIVFTQNNSTAEISQDKLLSRVTYCLEISVLEMYYDIHAIEGNHNLFYEEI